VIIPHFNPGHQYDYWSDGGILAPGSHLTVTGLIGQWFHAWPGKLQTIVLLLLPTAFIALRSPLILVAGPSLLLRFLATNSAFWGTVWHYNATVMPVIFVAAIDAMARIDAAAGAGGLAAWGGGRLGARRAVLARARRYGAAMMLAITVPLAFQFPLSTLWNAQSYRINSHVRSADIAQIYPGHVYTEIFQSGDVYVFRSALQKPVAGRPPGRVPALSKAGQTRPGEPQRTNVLVGR
jgi:uncharacterized membrane protein